MGPSIGTFRMSIGLFLLLAGVLSAEPALKVQETPVGSVDGLVIDSLCPSPDAKHLAYAIKKAGKFQPMLDDKPVVDTSFESIASAGIVFSTGSDRVAYLVGIGEGKWVVVVDGKPSKPYDTFARGSLVFGPDGKRVAAVADQGGKRLLLLDGVEGPAVDDIATFCFSPDGKRWAYAARSDTSWKIVGDSGESKPYDGILEGTPLFSPDGGHFAFVASRANQWFVVIDDRESKAYDQIIPQSLVFSADGKRSAFTAIRGGETLAVVDGVEGKPCHAIQGPVVFSADGKRVAVVSRQQDKWAVLVDDAAGSPFDKITGPPVFSSDGSRVAYAGLRGGQAYAIVDGKESAACDEILQPPIVSPDGKRSAFLARRGDQQFAVIDGVEGTSFLAVGRIAFSPDNKHVALGVQDSEGTHLMLDNQPSAAFGGFIHGSRIVFDSPAGCNALLFRGSQLLSVHASLE